MSEALSLREQSDIADRWLVERLDTVLPAVMERAGIDCWVLAAREYNEDPVVKTMLPATWITARRRTILVFTAYGRKRVAIARYAVGDAFPAAWDPEADPDQWGALSSYLDGEAPQRIGVNRSSLFAVADGMSASEHEAFRAALPTHLRERLVAADDIAVGWLETRAASEIEAYPDVCQRAHGILRRALSSEVVEPGTTTTADVEWWLRQEVQKAGYRTWFQPTVSVQREDSEGRESFAAQPGPKAIQRGDLVHIDFGIEYLGLHTDQQQHAYALREGETGAPRGLGEAFAKCNRLQDIVTGLFQANIYGNELLAAARSLASEEGLEPSIYSHPIGLHGHGAGPTIGLWDQQGGVPGTGDYPIYPNTAYSIELSVIVPIPEWSDQRVRIMLEEDGFFDGHQLRYLDGRQTELWLI